MGKTIKICALFIRPAVIAASLGMVLLTCGNCSASCGEYVYSRHRTPHAVIEDRLTGAMGQQDIWKSELFPAVHAHRFARNVAFPLQIPCRGPNCQKSPTSSLPVSAPETVSSGRMDRLILGRVAVEIPSAVSRHRDLAGSVRVRRGFPLLIEMPPQLSP